jgi:hypothetical protein
MALTWENTTGYLWYFDISQKSSTIYFHIYIINIIFTYFQRLILQAYPIDAALFEKLFQGHVVE